MLKPPGAPSTPLLSENVLSITDFGVFGDGDTDDSDAFQDALTLLENRGGGTLHIPAAVYAIREELTYDADDLCLQMEPGAVLDFSGSPYNNQLLRFQGTEDTPIPLTVNTTAGGAVLTVASHDIEIGDLVKVGAEDLFDAGRTDTEVGEIGEVSNVTATTVTLRSPLIAGPYTTANSASVAKITPRARLRIEGGTIRGAGLESVSTTTLSAGITDSDMSVTVGSASSIASTHTIKIDNEYININGKAGNVLTVYASGEGRGAYGSVAAAHSAGATVTIASTHYGLVFDLCADVTVKDVTFEDCFLMSIKLADVVRARITGCRFDNSRRWNSGYGVQVLSAAQDVQITNNFFSRCRHSMTTGGASTTGRKGIARRILFQANQVMDSYGNTGDAIDTHAASEDVSIIGNFVYDAGGVGINFECPSGKIADNQVIRTGNIGIYFHNDATPDTDITISGNTVRSTGGTGIQATTGTVVGSGAEQRAIVVSDNAVSTPAGRGIYVGSANSSIRFDGVVISCNVVNSPTSEGIKALRCDYGSITGNTVRGIPTGNDGLVVDTSTYMAVSGNTVQHNAVSQTGIQFTDVDNGTINGNVITGSNVGITLDNDCTYIAVVGNSFQNTTSPIGLGTGTGNRAEANLFTPSSQSVASAATITFPAHLSYAIITGTTGITSITASWPGRRVTLRFSSVLTVTDGSNLKLAGDFTSSTDDTLSLISDGTNWWETSRSVN